MILKLLREGLSQMSPRAVSEMHGGYKGSMELSENPDRHQQMINSLGEMLTVDNLNGLSPLSLDVRKEGLNAIKLLFKSVANGSDVDVLKRQVEEFVRKCNEIVSGGFMIQRPHMKEGFLLSDLPGKVRRAKKVSEIQAIFVELFLNEASTDDENKLKVLVRQKADLAGFTDVILDAVQFTTAAHSSNRVDREKCCQIVKDFLENGVSYEELLKEFHAMLNRLVKDNKVKYLAYLSSNRLVEFDLHITETWFRDTNDTTQQIKEMQLLFEQLHKIVSSKLQETATTSPARGQQRQPE